MELVAQVRVLLDQPLTLRVDEPRRLDRVGDHRRDDAEECQRAIVVAAGVERQVDAERADRPAIDDERDADEAELLARELGTLVRAAQEHRLAADLRHDDRPAALHDPAGDAFAQPVAGPPARRAQPDRGLDGELGGVRLEDRHGAANGVVMALEDLQHGMEAGLEIERPGQGLADLDERGELADLGAVIAAGPPGPRLRGGSDTFVAHAGVSDKFVGSASA